MRPGITIFIFALFAFAACKRDSDSLEDPSNNDTTAKQLPMNTLEQQLHGNWHMVRYREKYTDTITLGDTAVVYYDSTKTSFPDRRGVSFTDYAILLPDSTETKLCYDTLFTIFTSKAIGYSGVESYLKNSWNADNGKLTIYVPKYYHMEEWTIEQLTADSLVLYQYRYGRIPGVKDVPPGTRESEWRIWLVR